jgi:ketosteroid isomerase-like protein
MAADKDAIVQELLEQKARTQRAWVNGEVSPEIFGQRKDVTLLNPFGGYSGRGQGGVQAVQQNAISHFAGGGASEVESELLHAMVSDDLAVLVVIERSQVRLKGYDEPRPWHLRVTQVFQRDGDEWRSVHRHADPLVRSLTLEEVQALMVEPAREP